MAETHDFKRTFIAGENLYPNRRVKLHSTPTQVVYADAADGDGWIGTVDESQPLTSGYVVSGDPVTVILRGEGRTMKFVCSEAVDNGDALYPENDGKVSDTAGSVVIGTALSAGSGNGAVIEGLPNAGSGSLADEESVQNADATTGAGIPILLRKSGITASTTTTVIPKPSRKLQVIDVWVTQLGTTSTTVTLKNGSTAFTDAIAAGTTAGVRTRAGTFTTANATLAASNILNVALQTADPTGVEVVVVCLPIS